ncbi:MAG: helix-hairpin-helix domain-containing protein [Bacteroidales bacterium]|nr:helix-hairpin-helix domain-containing protein [Bacteroidales bacterium]
MKSFKKRSIKDFIFYIRILNLWIFILFIFTKTALYSQSSETTINRLITNLIEEFSESSDEELDYSLLFDDLLYYSEFPLNINAANHEELQSLHVLNDFQIATLIEYIKTNGELLSLYELSYVFGFTPEVVQKIQPFVTVSPVVQDSKIKLKNINKFGRHEFILRSQSVLQEQKGYIPIPDSVLVVNPEKSRYLGNPLKIYSRYTYHYLNRVYAGFIMEKDAGEEFFTGSNPYGFDFYSGYIQVNSNRLLKQFILGDFYMRAGQGLTLWNGLSFGKSGLVSDVNKSSDIIRRNTSAEENGYFRGVAATMNISKFDATVFISRKKRDANLTDTSENGEIQFTSLQENGLHSTPGEIADENTISETSFGAHLTYTGSVFKIGLTAANYRYSKQKIKDDSPYNLYDFQGNQLSNAGVNYQVGFKKIQLFGESSYSYKGFGILQGALFYTDSRVLISAIYRNYQPGFFSPYCAAFSESSDITNEKGLYLGTELKLVNNLKFTAYYDLFEFPWLRYNLSSPSTGNDTYLRLDYTPSRKVMMYAKFKLKNKQQNSDNEMYLIETPVDKKQWSFRYLISYPLLSSLTMKNSLEWKQVHFEGDISRGFLFYHDLVFNPSQRPFSIRSRMAWFNTDNYDTRIYAYENDVLYNFSVPAYYYKGLKGYFLIKYSLTSWFDFWFRISHTWYANRNFIGSGLTEIQGSNKTEIKFQIRIHI